MRKKVESVHNSLIVRKDLSEFRLRFGEGSSPFHFQ